MVRLSSFVAGLLAVGITIPPIHAAPPLESGRVLRQLNLSNQQLLEIRRIRNEYSSRIQPLQEQMRQQVRELQQLLASNAPAQELRQKQAQISQLHQQLASLRFEQTLAIREVLTPAQRQQLAELVRRRRRP